MSANVPVCGECGADCELFKVTPKEIAQVGDVLGEWRCSNGHVRMQFLRPTLEAIETGVQLMRKHRVLERRAANPAGGAT